MFEINEGNKKKMGSIHVYVDSTSILGRVKIQKKWVGKFEKPGGKFF